MPADIAVAPLNAADIAQTTILLDQQRRQLNEQRLLVAALVQSLERATHRTLTDSVSTRAILDRRYQPILIRLLRGQ